MNKYAKAVVGAVIAGAGSLQVALLDNAVSTTEWIQIGSAFVVALGLVWGVQNAPAPTAKTEPVA
jgi:hypothetical protein